MNKKIKIKNKKQKHHHQQVLAKMWGKRNPNPLQSGCKLVQPLWKKIWRLLKNLNIDLPYDPAIPLLGEYIQRNATQVTPKAPVHPCLFQCYSQ
jgi:hypothetical protein